MLKPAAYDSPGSRRRPRLRALLLAAVMMPAGTALAEQVPVWTTVVNNGDAAPTSVPQGHVDTFFSYNQPGVNDAGLVVWRGRAKPLESGGGGEPTRGIYTRDMLTPGAPVNVIMDNLGVLVPQPNNQGATFTEFPSTPRIDSGSSMVASRGQSQPVYTLPDDTKVGTSGIYTNPGGVLTTGASQLGGVPGLEYFQVPGATPGTKFDQFPGSPAATGGNTVVFKGNYTDGTSQTGVFYRDVVANGGTSPVELVARSGMAIPGGGGAVFGSTAPPSASNGKLAFTGLDNEEAPTVGGIYVAPIAPTPALTPIATIGSAVPGVAGQTFTLFGEGLSFTGNRLGFWGAWGAATTTLHLDCPTDGNAALLAFCQSTFPTGTDVEVPVNQGIFVADVSTGAVDLVAQTGEDGFTDFLYWTFSGMPPGVGPDETDGELPRWRSSAFVAVDEDDVAFKGQKGEVDGLYGMFSSLGAGLTTLLDTTMPGTQVDAEAPVNSLISSIGIERDGFRNNRLAITAGMLDAETTESWAGVYLTDVPEPGTLGVLAAGGVMLGLVRRRRRR